MSEEIFNYDTLMEQALVTVVKEVLQKTSEKGLLGRHHFYMTFQTNRPDVLIDEELRLENPEEMTIVLQHQFWDLKVFQEFFKVTLMIKGIAQEVTVPFSALVAFFDPSVNFGLQFSPVFKGNEENQNKDSYEGRPHDENDGPKVVSLESFRKK